MRLDFRTMPDPSVWTGFDRDDSQEELERDLDWLAGCLELSREVSADYWTESLADCTECVGEYGP